MAFKNLEQRFNERVNDLYAGAKLKFDGGRASTGINDDPLMVRNPGDVRFGIKQEGRSVPFNSAPRDVVRLTLFTTSFRGIAFLAKQQLLQTGNTFEQTRLINPAFTIGNAIPFLHIRRHLRPITGQFGIASSRDSIRNNERLLGQLQQSTYDTLEARYKARGKDGSSANLLGRLGGKLKSLAQPFISTLSAFTAPRDVGEKFGRSTPGDNKGWDRSRPELGTIVLEVREANRDFLNNTDEFFAPPDRGDYLKGGFGGGSFGYLPAISDPNNPFRNLALRETSENAQPFLKYFSGGTESIKNRLPDEMNARDRAANARLEKRRISYIRDPLNTNSETESNVLDLYKNLKTVSDNGSEGADDAIVVSFAMGKDAHVQFRALITDLRQDSTPDYKVHQYVGRIEKFISYATVQRSISFKLQVLAFSKEELDNVWTRINYLNAFVFPYGFDKGVLQPNIIRATIGSVYKDQPMYITGMNINFSDYSWDIDEGVPIAADIDIQATLIEKNTAFANKPFFGIVENILPRPPATITPNEPDLFIPEL